MSLERLNCPLKTVASDPQSADWSEALRFPGISTRISRTLRNGIQKSELLHKEGLIIKEIEKLPCYYFCSSLAVYLGIRVLILDSGCLEANPASHSLNDYMTLGKSFNTLSPSYKMVIIIAFTFMIFVMIKWHHPCKILVTQCLAYTKYSGNGSCFYNF